MKLKKGGFLGAMMAPAASSLIKPAASYLVKLVLLMIHHILIVKTKLREQFHIIY